jgi:hypothetical protein
MRTRTAALACVGAAVSLTACGGTQSSPPTGASTTTAGVVSRPRAVPTAGGVLAQLQAAGLPVTDRLVYDASTDPNHLLGRPTGYLSKSAWVDRRVRRSQASDTSQGSIELGGSVEVFTDATRAKFRAAYVQGIEQRAPIFGSEYDYLLGPTLLRVSGMLTPTQAARYGRVIGATLYHPSGG